VGDLFFIFYFFPKHQGICNKFILLPKHLFSKNGEFFAQKIKNHCSQGDEFPIVF
jgi:hypothetical protein